MLNQISRKPLVDLSIEELAYLHLDDVDLPRVVADGSIRSSIAGLVAEIRKTQSIDAARIFSPLYGAFALLDQIGSTYQNKTRAPYKDASASGIKKALYHFCGFPENSEEVKAIYGLRNSLMHDGSVLFRGRLKDGKWTGPFHHFRLGSKASNIVEMPKQAWNGKLEDLDPSKHATLINQSRLTEVAVNAVGQARRLLMSGDLGIDVGEGGIELYYKYLFHTKS